MSAFVSSFRSLVAAVLAASAVACANPVEPGPGPAPGPKPVAAVTVSPDLLSLQVHATHQLVTILRAPDGSVLTGRAVSWSSDDITKVAVDGSGRVIAMAAGSARITATSEGISATAIVTVTEPAPAPVAHVVLTPGNASLEPGKAMQATLRVYDAQGALLTGRTATWASSNETVATVDAQGRIQGHQGGTAWITVSVEGKTARVHVEVPMWLEYRQVTGAGAPAPVYTVVRQFQGQDVTVRVTIFGGVLRRSTTSNAYELYFTMHQTAEGVYFLDTVKVDRGTIEYNWGAGVRFVSTTTGGQEVVGTPTSTGYRLLQVPVEGQVKLDLQFERN